MVFFIFVIVVILVAYLFFSRKNLEDHNREVPKGDDFDGRSIGSMFLLEEIIDTDARNDGVPKQGFAQIEEMEDVFFEEEFFD